MRCSLSRLVVLVPTALLAACGSATGELPDARDAGRMPDAFADPPADAIHDPFADEFVTAAIPTVGVAEASAPAGMPLPSFATAPPPVFADPAAGDTPAFEVPDPEADTLLARLGHVRMRELGEPLVAARHVDAYLDRDAAVLERVAVPGPLDLAATRTLACPGGGRLEVSGESTKGGATHAIRFHGCVLAGATFDGDLVRTALRDGLRMGANEAIELDYTALRIESEGDSVTMTGTTHRSVERRTEIDCGGEHVEVRIAHRIATADVVRDDHPMRVTDAGHELVRESVPVRAASGDCGERITLTFDDDATVSGGRFGSARAILERSGRIVREAGSDREPPARASLDIAIDDGSSLSLELLSDIDRTARVNVLAEGVAVSFTTAYRFEE